MKLNKGWLQQQDEQLQESRFIPVIILKKERKGKFLVAEEKLDGSTSQKEPYLVEGRYLIVKNENALPQGSKDLLQMLQPNHP